MQSFSLLTSACWRSWSSFRTLYGNRRSCDGRVYVAQRYLGSFLEKPRQKFAWNIQSFGTFAPKRTHASSCPLKLASAELALILHLVDVAGRFDGLHVSYSGWTHKAFGIINRFRDIILANNLPSGSVWYPHIRNDDGNGGAACLSWVQQSCRSSISHGIHERFLTAWLCYQPKRDLNPGHSVWQVNVLTLCHHRWLCPEEQNTKG